MATKKSKSECYNVISIREDIMSYRRELIIEILIDIKFNKPKTDVYV